MTNSNNVLLRYATKEPDDCILKASRKYLKDVEKNWGYILPEEFHKIWKQNKEEYYIIDLRDADTYKKGHIPGAVNIYWEDILKPENIEKLPKNKKILLTCYLGHTSSQILVLLKMLGYSAVVSLKFGMGKPPKKGVKVAGWFDYDYEVEK